ncbi:conserved hypothetical protein [Arthrobacter sp. Hiyo4]|nr:conserved hypothetical protein [Arthrobacter sp. Hiyo4]
MKSNVRQGVPGKLSDMQETKPPAHPRRARLVVPSRSDLLLKNFTELIGGPMGARSAPGLVSPGVFTVERVLIILTVVAALAGLAIKATAGPTAGRAQASFIPRAIPTSPSSSATAAWGTARSRS